MIVLQPWFGVKSEQLEGLGKNRCLQAELREEKAGRQRKEQSQGCRPRAGGEAGQEEMQ